MEDTKKMQVKLLSRQEINCPRCLTLLENHKFSLHDMHQTVEATLAGLVETGPPLDAKPRKRQREDGEDDAEEDKVSSREEALAWLRTQEPTITLLPAGTFGKKLPYRCNICRTPSWPNGKVGELSKMRLRDVQTFVNNHLVCPSHRGYVKKAQQILTVPQVECKGVSINDAHEGGLLFELREEFQIWASMANFEGCAQHHYSWDATNSSWRVQSKSCEKNMEQPGPNSPAICAPCLKLIGSHMASCLRIWHDFEPVACSCS